MAFWMTSWVYLHQLAFGQNADGVIQLGQKAGHRGLACPRVAQKHQMQGHGGNGQARLFPEAAHLHQIDQAFHIPLHLVQSAQPVQLGQQLLQSGL